VIARRLSILLALAALASGTAIEAQAAEPPAGPRLLVSQVGPGFSSKLFTVGPRGTDRQVLASRSGKQWPIFAGRGAWSPNGSRLLVAGVTSLKPTEDGIPTRLFVLPAGGGKLEPVKGTAGGLYPVFAPDGHTVAFAKDKVVFDFSGEKLRTYESAAIWLVDLDSGKTRQLTPWRNHLRLEPSSFSPDGSVLASTRTIAERPPEAVGIHLDGSAASVLVPGTANDPVFSPDGTRIAFLRNLTPAGAKHPRNPRGGRSATRLKVLRNDLYTALLGGAEQRRLTTTPTLNESLPSWDPSGQRLAYAVNELIHSSAEVMGASSRIRAVNADGTCTTDMLDSGQVLLGGPTWQPGPGREAGPISCATAGALPNPAW
jgi:Tol biopolymer transport system component